MPAATRVTLMKVYTRLFKAFGPQHWWPARTPFEVVVGAILTQNTNWGNVEKALNNLKRNNCLNPKALQTIPASRLASLIKPSGYFNIKAKRLKHFIGFLFRDYGGHLKKMKLEDPVVLRRKLLGVNGIGPETADSILLYAFGWPVFVIDAYTKRILTRHNLAGPDDDYRALQDLFMNNLKRDPVLFNEYHALIVNLGKHYCKPSPDCAACVLNNFRYSLKFKCDRCHRALPRAADRIRTKNGYSCRHCRSNRIR